MYSVREVIKSPVFLRVLSGEVFILMTEGISKIKNRVPV